jgi:hypothetical protein
MVESKSAGSLKELNGFFTQQVAATSRLFQARLRQFACKRPPVHAQPARRFGNVEFRLNEHLMNVLLFKILD